MTRSGRARTPLRVNQPRRWQRITPACRCGDDLRWIGVVSSRKNYDVRSGPPRKRSIADDGSYSRSHRAPSGGRTVTTEVVVQASAYTGDLERSFGPARLEDWLLRRHIERPRRLVAPEQIDRRNWRDPRVGWGIVLPMAACANDDLALGADAPEPIQRLLRARAPAPVLRYSPDFAPGMLRRYDIGVPPQDIFAGLGERGTARGCLPQYLLIIGSPAGIPWEIQYDLNGSAFVGRLDLPDDSLERYVDALISDWREFPGTGWNRTAVWAPVHAPTDITRLMRDAIAERAHNCFVSDTDIATRARFVDGAEEDASEMCLIRLLAEHRPGIVVTTSHGTVAPLDAPEILRQSLGLPVDSSLRSLSPRLLLRDWHPSGAIWSSHACCSAGVGGASDYQTLFEPTTSLGQLFSVLSELQPCQAPLPTMLLGASCPLRAFIGHVEPTFDCTMRAPSTGQQLTRSLLQSLYHGLCSGAPVGHAFRACFANLASLSGLHEQARRRFNGGSSFSIDDLAICLMASDWRSMVILGDPSVSLRKIP